jgi:DnaJ-domain-containing protein 1
LASNLINNNTLTGLNYFEFYTIEESFFIDKKALRKAYLDKSREVHPDTQDVPSTPSGDLDLAAYNNEAYTALNEDLGVIKHLLDIYEIPLDAKNAPMPTDFLMDMMELNENIDALQSGGGNLDEVVSEVDALQHSITSQHMPVLKTFNKAMSFDEKSTILNEAKDYFLKMNYVRRLRENLAGSASL